MYKIIIFLVAFLMSAVAFAGDKMWHIKCFNKQGQTINVKAFDEGGKIYKVKAVKSKGDHLDIKAFSKSGVHHVKVMKTTTNGMMDVKAVKGTKVIAIKGVGSDGKMFHVKAFKDNGVYHIKCVDNKGDKYGLKAISPSGVVYDVKGITNVPGEPELEVDISAHVKAVPKTK